MNFGKYFFITAVLLGLHIPIGGFAAESETEDLIYNEEPTYQNPSQAEHAENLQDALISPMEAEAARLAAEEAEQSKIGTEAELKAAKENLDILEGDLDASQVKLSEARQEVKRLREELLALEEEAKPGENELEVVKEELEQVEDDPDPSKEELEALLEQARKDRRAAKRLRDGAQEMFDQGLIDFQAFEEELDDANAAYDKATEAYVSILGQRADLADEIHQMRQTMGWGQIYNMFREELGANGVRRGQYRKENQHMVQVQVMEPDLEDISLEAEIEQVTTRNRYEHNVRNRNQVSTKQKANSKKWIGLNETSLKAEAAVSDVGAGNGKSFNGKGGSSAVEGKANNSNKSQTSLSSVSSPSGKDKSNNGNNGKSSNSAKSDKNDRGNSGNNGKNDKNDRGNSDNNGNGKGKK